MKPLSIAARRAMRASAAFARAVAAALLSPAAIVAWLCVGGFAAAVLGTLELAGRGWALVCAAGLMFVLAWALARGMSNG